jgi:hypothetical protein
LKLLQTEIRLSPREFRTDASDDSATLEIFEKAPETSSSSSSSSKQQQQQAATISDLMR